MDIEPMQTSSCWVLTSDRNSCLKNNDFLYCKFLFHLISVETGYWAINLYLDLWKKCVSCITRVLDHKKQLQIFSGTEFLPHYHRTTATCLTPHHWLKSPQLPVSYLPRLKINSGNRLYCKTQNRHSMRISKRILSIHVLMELDNTPLSNEFMIPLSGTIWSQS